MRYWLFKSEPTAYSFDDLVSDGVAEWDGVRNFQARNLLRDEIKEGDGVLFYHSSAKPMAVIGTAVVVRDGYPDATAADPTSLHPRPEAHCREPHLVHGGHKRARALFRAGDAGDYQGNACAGRHDAGAQGGAFVGSACVGGGVAGHQGYGWAGAA